MNAGVSGEITRVKRLKKNKVAFGFSTLVRNQIFTASRGVISSFLISAWISICHDFVLIAQIQRYMRYAAPMNFIIWNRSIDWEMMSAIQARQYAIWIEIQSQNPTAVHKPVFLE